MPSRLPPLFLLALFACSSKEPDVQTQPPTGTATGTATATGTGTGTATGTATGTGTGTVDALGLPPAGLVEHPVTSTASVCVDCHSESPSSTAMRDSVGDSVAMVDLWKGTMMANSARDPLWRAVVSAEVATNPNHAEEIEGICIRCHAPALSEDAISRGVAPRIADLGNTDDPGALGRDGVTCTVCHQIEPDNLGQEDSYTGGYVLGTDPYMYGPYADPFGNPMTMHTPHEPTHGPHILESELCATCHELETHTFDASGTPDGGTYLEQTTYREWEASAYATAASCQDCHLPQVDDHGVPISTMIATSPMGQDFAQISARSPYGQHQLVGGNTLVPAILAEFSGTLNPDASDAQLVDVQERSRRMLENQSAVLSISGTRVGDELSAQIEVVNLTGHKLPTGIPARRAWLEVAVTDSAGTVLLHSGGTDAEGRLVAGGAVLDSELVGGPARAHLTEVRTDTDVVTYENVLADTSGTPTWRLLRAASSWKDTRLLPQGFDPAVADGALIAPVGVTADPDFSAGGDTVQVVIDVSQAVGEVEIAAWLRYQPLSPRFAAELFDVATPEALALEQMLTVVGQRTETLAEDSLAL